MSLSGFVKLVTNSLLRTKFPMRSAGELAPDFSTTDHEGRPLRLSDLRGKYVVLWFFPKADTPG